MIAITINSEALDLYENTSIRLEKSNPMFDFDSIPGAIVFPFKIPHTARNLRLLKYPDTIMNVALDTPFDAVLILAGLHYADAVLRIDQVVVNESTIYLTLDAGDFLSLIKELSLKEIDLGQLQIGTTEFSLRAFMNQTTIDSWPNQAGVFFPFRNEAFVGEDSYTVFPGAHAPATPISPTCPILNYYHAGTFEEWWAQFGETYGLSVKSTNSTPAIYIAHILQRICAHAGYSFEGIFQDDQELAALVMQSLTLIRDDASIDHVEINTLVPDIDLQIFLVAVRRLFCLSLDFSSKNQRVTFTAIRDILQADAKDDWTEFASPEFKLDRRYAEEFHFDWTLDSNDAASVDEVQPTITFALKGSVADVASLPVSAARDDIWLVIQEWRYYTWNGIDWIFYSHPLQPFGNSSAAKQVKSIFSPVAMEFSEDTIPTDYFWDVIPPSRSWKIPYMSQEGTYTFAKRITSEIKPRLLFYRGMQPDTLGNDYPFASADTTDGAGNVVGNYALSWQDEAGIYETWWKDYVDFIYKTRLVTLSLDLEIAQIINLDFHRKKRINGVDYFINKLSTTITMDGISAVTAELYKA